MYTSKNVRYRLGSVFALTLLLTVVISTNCLAQGTGTLSGVVIEEETSETLPVANVILEGDDRRFGTSTGDLGRFRINDVPSGTYSLRVSFVGYEMNSREVVIEPNQTTDVEIRMESKQILGEGVTVTGYMEGKMKSLVQERNANFIQEVVSTEEMDMFPDKNTAEVLQRVPGITIRRSAGEGQLVLLRGTQPRLTKVTMDGHNLSSPEESDRVVPLDIIQSNNLSSVEVKKTQIPDNDASSIGGTVNLETKTAFDFRKDKNLSVSADTGFHSVSNEPQYSADILNIIVKSKKGKGLNPTRRKAILLIMSLLLTGFLFGSCDSDTGDKELILSSDRGPQVQPVDLSVYQNIWYVSAKSGSDIKENGSKENPWKSISFALDQIKDASDANRSAILVAEGTYQSMEAISMKPYIDLYGGFDTKNWDRNIFQHKSTLDGQNSHRLVIGSDHAVLDGFVLTQGMIRGNGGALLAEGTSPTIRNNIFVRNQTLKPQDWKPELWHKTANDGGAVACINGCSAIIKHNLFVQNNTEIGRGAAFACDNEATKETSAAPQLIQNVFLDNITSTGQDTMRSGDGGAISYYGYCKGAIRDNIVSENEASSKNDGGGIFIALWSDPEVTGNIVVGNKSRDDGGGIFIGGQKHHYETPKEPVPDADSYFIKVNGNVVMGNQNGAPTSDAMRATMMSRGTFKNNIFVHNPGGVHCQRAELTFRNNVFVDDLLYEDEENQAPGPTVFVNNIITGETNWKAEVTEGGSHYENTAIKDDGFSIITSSASFHPDHYITTIQLKEGNYPSGTLEDRIVETENGRWTVILSNDKNSLQVWGDYESAKKLKSSLHINFPKT